MTNSSMGQQGCSIRAMTRMLHRAPPTISREIARNTSASVTYGSHIAQQRCQARHCVAQPRIKLNLDGVTWMVVLTLLEWKWSPQQISATLKCTFPNASECNVSHETIHTAIYAQPRGELRRQLIACLRFGRSTRLPCSRGTYWRGQIPNMVSIQVRPPEVDDHVMPWHWEGDLIKGADNELSVGVLVERPSRLVLLAKMADTSIAAPMRHTLTYDQGKELGCRADLAAQTGVKVYLCGPHNPWQHGTCENTNGLLRQYLPMGIDLSVHSQDELGTIADSLNTRPRATHGFNTPLAVFSHFVAMAQRPPSSIH